jgi:uridine kinase
VPAGLDLVIAAARAAHTRKASPVLVALDGRSGTGKSTIAETLARRLAGVAVTVDDFWPGGSDRQWSARTVDERVADVIDWRRLRAEVLEPLLAGRPARWPTDRSAESSNFILLDGAYSARPELADLVDVAVLVTLDDSERRRRLLAREGQEFMRRWHQLWDGAEAHYFANVRPPESFDIVLDARRFAADT